MNPSWAGLGLLALAVAISGCFHSESSGYALPELGDPANTDPNATTGLALLNGVLVIYNQHVAGQSTGSHEFGASCPNGGTVRIQGWASYDSWHGLTRISLQYEFSQCGISQAAPAAQLVLMSGSLRQEGSFDSAGYASESFLGTLDYAGTVGGQAVSHSGCAVTISHVASGFYRGAYRSVSGQLCGAPFALRPAGPEGLLLDAQAPPDAQDGSADAPSD